MTREEALAWLEKQHTDPYNGVYFDCYGHHWSMCARDNGIEIAMDRKPVRQFSYKDCEQTFGYTPALEAINEEIVDNQNCIKPANKVEPKFKVGDWIVHQGTENIYQVVAHIDNQYQLKYGDNYTVQKCADVDRCARLWTIADAKNGDVLTIDGFIFIYKNIDEDNGVHYHCHYELNKHGDDEQFAIAMPGSIMGTRKCHYLPASREQCDLIFSKMRESGYKWYVEKKEAKKIEPKILLNADEVIEWLKKSTILADTTIERFKQDFGL